jgi:hypothetical protein
MMQLTSRHRFLQSAIGIALWSLIVLSLGMPRVVIGQSPAQWPYPKPIAGDDTGFSPIFDDLTLNGWDGELDYWRVENGSIVGETTPVTPLKDNTFLIWRRGVVRDFELTLEYRISRSGNSGVEYRAAELNDKKWGLRGYQADIAGPEWAGGLRWPGKEYFRATGENYEDEGRMILALTGQLTQIRKDGTPRSFASIGGTEGVEGDLGHDGWKTYRIIARGNVLIQIVDGHLMSVVIDDDAVNARSVGLLGLQLHMGKPMKVEFRNIQLKKF